MNLLQHLMEGMERLRPIVGHKSWDYCVIWKLSEDQRYLECMDCCCAGTDHNQTIHQSNNGGGEELLFPVSSACKDVMFPHQRTKSCDLLSQLPSSISLDSGIHAQTLISNQPRWFNFANGSDSNGLEETVGTRVLIPVPFGLVEMFVDKQVSEDQRIIDFITSQFNFTLEHQSTINGNDHKADDIFPPPVSPATMIQNLTLQDEISGVDEIRLCNNSSMNFFQQFNYATENGKQNNGIFQESNSESFPAENTANPFTSENGFEQEIDALQKHMNIVEPLRSKKRQLGKEKDSLARSGSPSGCSDFNEDEDEGNDRRRNGKGPQSKNLVAERKRRKKLNDRLYNLRSLVPKISKLDRASILGDAIEYVMELQKQVRDLQNELEEHSEDDDENNNNINNNTINYSAVQSEVVQGNNLGPKSEQNIPNDIHTGDSGVEISKQNQDHETNNDHKVQQMEPQVEVAQLDGNEFFVKVFCEHKAGGFVKLMEALNSLGLEVTNVNVTSFRSLVVNVFKVEKKDSEMVQADHVRDSLLELTRNPSSKVWPEISKASENNSSSSMDHGRNHHHHHHNHHHPYLHSHQLNPQAYQHHHHRHIHHLHN